MKKKNCFKTLVLCSLAAFGFAACNDAWEDHYQVNEKLNPTETLWDVISNRTDLSEFAAALKKTGYDKLFQGDRYYTVWAPKNGTVTVAFGDSLLQMEFVENHVADYNHPASGTLEDNRIELVNGKYCEFVGASGNYTFKTVPLVEKNIAAKNGTLHVINGFATFTPNIWERLAKIDSLSLINEFLRSFDEVKFSESQSVQGPIVNGQITYLDSVTVENNRWFSYIGRLNREDSTYIMIAPTNRAWREMYEKSFNYFKFPKTKEFADSLQRYLAKEAICKHLVFSKGWNHIKDEDAFLADADSLISNYYSSMNGIKFYNWYYYTNEFGKRTDRIPAELGGYRGEIDDLFRDTQKEELSNGSLYITDKLGFTPIKCWHDTIKIEGESGLYVEGTTCTTEVESINKDSVDIYKHISKGHYAVFTPTTSRGNPTITFTIPNVLSAPYLIKVVFVPANIINKKETELLPNKFNWSIQYTPTNGKVETQTLGKAISNDPTRIDTLTLIPSGKMNGEAITTDYVEFPCNEYGASFSDIKTQLILKSNVSSSDKASDRTFRIDCVILEPVDKETYQKMAAAAKFD